LSICSVKIELTLERVRESILAVDGGS